MCVFFKIDKTQSEIDGLGHYKEGTKVSLMGWKDVELSAQREIRKCSEEAVQKTKVLKQQALREQHNLCGQKATAEW